MRMILMALALGISVAAVASPTFAAPETDGDKTDLGTVQTIVAQPDRETPQVGVAVIAGSDEQRPLTQQWRYENQEGQ